MKTNKGFTLIELLVVIVILAAVTGLIGGVVNIVASNPTAEEAPEFISPEQVQADELRRANDLKERELRLLEAREAREASPER